MVLTEEQIKEIVANTPKLERIKKPKPAAAPVSNVVLATERKLSVDGQRERVARSLKDLIEVERQRRERGGFARRRAKEFYSAQARVLSEAARLACGEQING